MLGAGRKEKQRFGRNAHLVVEKQRADLFPEGSAARLAGAHDLNALLLEKTVQRVDLGRFARPVDALEGDEFSSCHGRLTFVVLLSAKRAGLAGRRLLILFHRPVVFGERARKVRRAVAARHKVQVLRVCRIESRVNRSG